MNTEYELLRSGATARDAAMATGSRPGLHVGCQRASDDEETLSGGTSGQIELVVECQASAASRGVTLQHAPGLTTFSATALRQACPYEPMPADIDSAEPAGSQPSDGWTEGNNMDEASGVCSGGVGIRSGQRRPAGAAGIRTAGVWEEHSHLPDTSAHCFPPKPP